MDRGFKFGAQPKALFWPNMLRIRIRKSSSRFSSRQPKFCSTQVSINSTPSLVWKTMFSALKVLMRHHRVWLGVPNPSKAPLSQAVLDLFEVLAAKNGGKCQQPGFRNLLGSLPGTVAVSVAGDESLRVFWREMSQTFQSWTDGSSVTAARPPMNEHLLHKVTCKQCFPLILSRK